MRVLIIACVDRAARCSLQSTWPTQCRLIRKWDGVVRQQEAAQTRASRGNAGKNGGLEAEMKQKQSRNLCRRGQETFPEEGGAFLVEGADGE
jgi:hypothetical protein